MRTHRVLSVLAPVLLALLSPFPAQSAPPGPSPASASGFVRMDDMVIPSEALDLDNEVNGLAIEPFGAVKANVHLWEDGVLPLVFSKKIAREKRDRLLEACAEWSKVANVKCIEGSYKRRHLKVMALNQGCWSLFGMGRQFVFLRRTMNLGPGCWSKGTLVHELGHAFGLIHEHQRPDRDDYVRIIRSNIRGGFLGLNPKVNFGSQASYAKTPYDFFSIMHYRRNSFSKNGQDTIVPQDEYLQFIDVMGQIREVSPGDAQTLAMLYGRNP